MKSFIQMLNSVMLFRQKLKMESKLLRSPRLPYTWIHGRSFKTICVKLKKQNGVVNGNINWYFISNLNLFVAEYMGSNEQKIFD